MTFQEEREERMGTVCGFVEVLLGNSALEGIQLIPEDAKKIARFAFDIAIEIERIDTIEYE